MLIKVGEIAEGLSAFTALKGLFSGVNSPVLREGRAVTEGLSTLVAFVRLFSSVNF